MAEREDWEVVAQRYGLYKKMLGVDGYDLTQNLTEAALKGLSRREIEDVLNAHGLRADKFFENEAFWDNIQKKLNENG